MVGFNKNRNEVLCVLTKKNKKQTLLIPTYTGHGCRGPVQFKTRNYRLATVKSRLPVARHNLGWLALTLFIPFVERILSMIRSVINN